MRRYQLKLWDYDLVICTWAFSSNSKHFQTLYFELMKIFKKSLLCQTPLLNRCLKKIEKNRISFQKRFKNNARNL